MKSKINRRKFIKRGAQAGMACCALMMSSKLVTAGGFGRLFDDEKIDPKKLNFCGYSCPADCKFHIATLENDIEKKKEAFGIWKIKEKYEIEFDPETAVCWKCKDFEKKQGVVVSNCTVRACAKDKGYDACIECGQLKSCDKDLWTRFPDFHKAVIEMQVKYKEQTA